MKKSLRLDPLCKSWMWSAAALAALAGCGGGGGGGGDSAPPANSAPTVGIDAPTTNQSFTSTDAIRIAATAADADGTVVKVEFFDGTTKIGEDTSAPFEFSWTGASVGSHDITVRATDNAGATTISATRPITVVAPTPSPPPPPPAPNVAPVVSIASPANNFKLNAPATLDLVANATDSDGSVAKVEFFRINPAAPVFDATTLVGRATAGTAPSFTLRASALPAGTYTFVARVTDNLGATANSSSIQVVVNALPVVALTDPTAGASVPLGSTKTLRATATDADGSIAKVEFFIDGSATALGQGARVGTTSEYTLPWSNFSAGAHSIVVRATDNDGAVQSTASVSVNVPANALPTVTLDAPAVSGTAPATVTLTASASDTDGSITKVEFFENAASVGLGTFDAATSKYRLVRTNRPAGTTTVTATATDNLGGTTTTASRSLTIAANPAPTVAMTSAATFNLPAAVVLTASATDADGIAKVEFFNGATKLGETATSPYSFTWGAATAGTFNITARATDTVGSVATSVAQTVTVNPNTAGDWSTLTDAQKAGMPLAPNKPVEDQAVDAVEVMTAIGVNLYIPSFNPTLAHSARLMAELTPAAGTTATCPGGGTLQSVAGADATKRIFNYNNCVIGGYSLYGGAGLTPYVQIDDTVTPPVPHNIFAQVDYEQLSATSYRLVMQGLMVTGNGAPVPGGESYPRNAHTYTVVTCNGTGSAKICVTNMNVSFQWANDISWSGYSDNGTGPASGAQYATDDRYILSGMYRPSFCESDPTPTVCLANPPAARNFRFESMTNRDGRAIVYGNNGYSVVTRLAPVSPGVERLSVVRTITGQNVINGVTYPTGTVPAVTVECTVSPSTGDWSCRTQ